MGRPSACSTQRGHWGWLRDAQTAILFLLSPVKRNTWSRVYYYRHNFNLIVSQDFRFGQNLPWAKKKPTKTTLYINEFSSFRVSWLWALQMRHPPTASKYLKTVQNATNRFWNFTVPNSAVSALLPHRLPFAAVDLDWSTSLVLYRISRMCEIVKFTHTLNCSAGGNQRQIEQPDPRSHCAKGCCSSIPFQGRSLWSCLLTRRYSYK